MLTRIFTIGLILVLLWVYIRYFERKNIYYPTKRIELIPEDVGLTYEDVFFETRDGVKLNGWFIPANDSRATLLFCHGNAGNISHRLEIVEIFNRIGLNVFIFDYRGYGKSRGCPSEKGTYLDAQSAFDYLVSKKDVDRDKIIIYGKSLGGAIAVDLAQKVNAKALIIESAFTSTLNLGGEIYPFLPVKLIVTMKYDTISKIGKINSPKLIIHSRDDEIVAFHHGQQLFEKAKPPKEFYEVKGGHNETILMTKDGFQEKVKTFLDKYDAI